MATVDAGLDEHNVRGAALHDVRPLHVIASDEDGRVIGGAIGRTWGKCCELQQLWVATECRRRSEGRLLMEAFECEAARRGCELVYLETFSFQAPAFYARLGYEEVLRTAGFPGGVVKSTMHKRIVTGDRTGA
ncbi:MAG: GNAT family N-acetyltransferase [Betaproteobacteria bacterium]|nr:GNAT family N-acetyltransferase [Betaproteobacteria bacterium]